LATDWRAGVAPTSGAAETSDGGRGCLDSDEDRDGVAQRVARLAALRPSGGPGRVGWLGDRAESGARRRRQWGGRREP
jgi:hypothetical protein